MQNGGAGGAEARDLEVNVPLEAAERPVVSGCVLNANVKVERE